MEESEVVLDEQFFLSLGVCELLKLVINVYIQIYLCEGDFSNCIIDI